VTEPLPCPETVLHSPLDAVEAFPSRFVAYPSAAARVAHVLWIAEAADRKGAPCFKRGLCRLRSSIFPYNQNAAVLLLGCPASAMGQLLRGWVWLTEGSVVAR